MKLLLPLTILISFPAWALVSSPATVGDGQWSTEFRTTLERGKIEPNESKASFQRAEIDIYQLSLTRGLGSLSFGMDHFFRVDYRYFKSGKEEVGGQVFYNEDQGHTATFTYGFNIVHEAGYTAGVYASISPLITFNRDKFSSPRVDIWALGLQSGMELHSDWLLENSVHYGSGIPGKQNSYLAFTVLVGYRALSYLNLKSGPYAELDLSEHTDAKYDAAFSAPGRSDRIRSMKVGIASFVEIALPSDFFATLGYIQKLGGYDAPATNAAVLNIGAKF